MSHVETKFVPEVSIRLYAGSTPDEPWHRSSPALQAAHCRAGLSSWTLRDADKQSDLSGGAEMDSGTWQPPFPRLTIDCCVQNVVVTLPYGCDPGTAERFTELWAKAFALVRLLSIFFAIEMLNDRTNHKCP